MLVATFNRVTTPLRTHRYRWILGLSIGALPIVSGCAALLTGYSLLWWFSPLLFFIAIPIVDYLLGEDESNPDAEQLDRMMEESYYHRLVVSFVGLQYLSTLFACVVIAYFNPDWVAQIGILLSVAITNLYGINAAHELGHKQRAPLRWIAKCALAPVAYGHFFVEHNMGHHRHVATPLDPASAKMGENFWLFLPRTLRGGFQSAWRIEKQRLQRRQLPVWHWRNEVLQVWSITLVLYLGAALVLGWGVLILLILQSAFAITMLEAVNYLEHYGLLRGKRDDGSYERCNPGHSWNSNYLLSNILTFQIQRHSDHHANPTRPYQCLRHYEESPQLPFGYNTLLLFTLLPPLWFRVMNPRLAAHYDGDLSRAHVLESKREKLQQQYGKVRRSESTLEA